MEAKEKEEITSLIDVTRSIAEGDFYKEINIKLQGELGQLASYIDRIRKNLATVDPKIVESSDKMPQASHQLADINEMLESAANKMFDVTEKMMDDHGKMSVQLADLKNWIAVNDNGKGGGKGGAVFAEIEAMHSTAKDDLVELITNLSFQDLTGQKIKKLVALIEEVEAKVLELLVTFGHRKEGAASKEKVLQGLRDRTKPLQQGLVDDILKNLGM